MKNKPGRVMFSDFKSYQKAEEINTNGRVYRPLIALMQTPTPRFRSLVLYKNVRTTQREMNVLFRKWW